MKTLDYMTHQYATFTSAVFITVFLILTPVTYAEDLADQVQIRRTAYGVPHILGENLRAGGFGFGYAQAEDHLESLMMVIIRSKGESAKIFGGEDNLEKDFRTKEFRIQSRALESYHLLHQDYRELIEGYAAGVNYYIQLHRDDIQDWIQPITGHDVAIRGIAYMDSFAFDRGKIIDKFRDSLNGKTAKLETLDIEQDLMGSNQWALAPSRTKSGNAMLLVNPHLTWSQERQYYEAHLTVPGVINTYGGAMLGAPMFRHAFNDTTGWALTVNYPDLEEIYELDADPSAPDSYLMDGGSIPLRREEVSVEIKTDSGLRRETRSYWHSPIGPVIHRTPQKIYVIKSSAFTEFRLLEQWLRQAQARNLEEFKSALAMQRALMYNIAYADRDGNIFYIWNGRVPIIPHENKRSEAVYATTTDDMWSEVHAMSDLPQLLNPKGGYVMNSNSSPYLTNLHQPMDRDDFPDYFPDNTISLRTQHNLQLLHNDKKFSLEDTVELKHSTRVLLADRVKDDLIKAVRRARPNEETRNAIDLLERWDNTSSAESAGGVLFGNWWTEYSRDQTELYKNTFNVSRPLKTPNGLADRERAVAAFDIALEKTTEQFGRWDVTWGEVHRLRTGDLDLPLSGGSGRLGIFRVLAFKDGDDGKREARGADGFVMCIEFGDTPKAYSIVAYSQSEIELSPHYNDQAELFASNRMKRVSFTESEIRASLISNYRPGKELP
jgi:acyl-homoserine-lactone acylase